MCGMGGERSGEGRGAEVGLDRDFRWDRPFVFISFFPLTVADCWLWDLSELRNFCAFQ